MSRPARLIALFMVLLPFTAQADNYEIDGTGAGMHSFVQFKAMHIGISNLWGRFDDVTGSFTYDPDDVAASAINMLVATTTLNTNHAQRDQHLMSGDYMEAEAFPVATFSSTSVTAIDEDSFTVTGMLSIRDVEKEVSFDVHKTGEGRTPFGDFRIGFEAELVIDATDFGINLAPDPEVLLLISIEGIRQ